jgi:hypothetical protein
MSVPNAPAFGASSSSSSSAAHQPQAALQQQQIDPAEYARLQAENARLLGLGQSLQQRFNAVEIEKAQLAASLVKARSSLKAPPLAQFDGKQGTAVDAWLRNVQKQFVFHTAAVFPDAASKIKHASLYLDGSAADWWSTVDQSAVQSWDQFVACMHARYRPTLAADTARAQLAVLVQDRSVSAYCNRFQQLLTHIPDKSEADKVFEFKRGLKKPIAARVAEKHPDTLQSAIDIAVGVEQYVAPSSGVRQFVPFSGAGGAGGAAMDLNALAAGADDHGDEEPASAAVLSSAPLRSEVVMAKMLAKMEAMEQRLNAIGSSSSSSSSSSSGNKKSRIPGLTKEDIVQLQSENRCFRCKGIGHMKNECPQRA